MEQLKGGCRNNCKSWSISCCLMLISGNSQSVIRCQPVSQIRPKEINCRGATITEFLLLLVLVGFTFSIIQKIFIEKLQDQGDEIAYCIEFAGGGTIGSSQTGPKFNNNKKLGKLCGLNQVKEYNCTLDPKCNLPNE